MIRPQLPDSLMILIPAYNEGGAIRRVVTEVQSLLPQTPILVLDDCSTDDTRTEALAAGADVISVPYHLGLGGCVQAGYRYAYDAGFSYVIRIDGDGQHDPRFIPDLFAALRHSPVQMVIGSRYLNGKVPATSFARGVGIWFFRQILRLILEKEVHDPTSGFVGVNRQALEVFARSFPLEYPEIEALVVLQRRQFQFAEVPVVMRRRMAGVSTITALKSFYYVLHVLLGVIVNILKYEGKRRKG
ncbi:MAG: glycosyltransferase family 2 protein [Acidobacteriaceae bacterium]|nr:glycosyltransferase family 2 protein [Acidobacteriaceae bacterium]